MCAKYTENILTIDFNPQMSFGRPPSINVGFKPVPPDRGSFPLDHFGLNPDLKSLPQSEITVFARRVQEKNGIIYGLSRRALWNLNSM